jgi:hypothetical protein
VMEEIRWVLKFEILLRKHIVNLLI